MGCIFFEGFNHENTDYTKLDQTYWSGDYAPTFIKGRTDNAHIIPSRSSEDSNLSNNETLWLSGFPAITGSGAYYGAGFFISEISTNTSGNGSAFPYRENIVSFYDDQTEIFKLNTIWMLESGIAIELEQNNSYTGIALYQDPLPTNESNNSNHFIDSRTYTITTENDRRVLRLYTPSSDISITENTVSDICGADKPEIVTSSAIYLEVYGQANDGASPATTGNLHIKVDGLEITPSTGVAISGFNNLNRIQFHGTHYPSGECDEDTYSLSYSQYNSLQNENRIIDDLYIASGTGINEVNLGASVRIFKCVPNANSRYEWRRNQDYPIQTILSSNDNQTWAGSNVDGSMVVNQYSNIPTTNDIVDGIKVRNLNQSDYGQKNYCNIMISGSNASTGPFLTLGSPKSVDSRHFTDNNEFIFQNPATQTNWTKTDINQLKAGAMVGTITSDCEANGGYVIQDSGDEQANGVYCQNLSQGASINILSTSDTYYNTKNNGYYIAYEDSTEQDSGWYLRDSSSNKLYKNNAAQNSIAPITSWSLSDYGLYPPPSVTLSLNRGYYDETSQQNIHYMP